MYKKAGRIPSHFFFLRQMHSHIQNTAAKMKHAERINEKFLFFFFIDWHQRKEEARFELTKIKRGTKKKSFSICAKGF